MAHFVSIEFRRHFSSVFSSFEYEIFHYEINIKKIFISKNNLKSVLKPENCYQKIWIKIRTSPNNFRFFLKLLIDMRIFGCWFSIKIKIVFRLNIDSQILIWVNDCDVTVI